MHKFYHPHIEDITLTGILYALGEPMRFRLVKALYLSDESMNCSQIGALMKETCPKNKDVAPSTCTHHLRILRESGLVRSEKHGAEVRNVCRKSDLTKKFPGLLPVILKMDEK